METLKVWSRHDIEQSLAAVHETMTRSLDAAQGDPTRSAEYEQGFNDALIAISMAFGVPAPVRHANRILT
jgi:hypothetical protein